MIVEWFIGERLIHHLNVSGVSSLLTATQILETFSDTHGVTLWPNEALVCGDVSVLWYESQQRMTIQFADGSAFDHANQRMSQIASAIEAIGWID